MFHGTLSKVCIKPMEQVLFYIGAREICSGNNAIQEVQISSPSSATNESLSKVISLLYGLFFFFSSLSLDFLFPEVSCCGSFH